MEIKLYRIQKLLNEITYISIDDNGVVSIKIDNGSEISAVELVPGSFTRELPFVFGRMGKR